MHAPSVAAAASLFLLISALPSCKSKNERVEGSPPPAVPSKGSATAVAKPISAPPPVETGPVVAADAVADCDALLTPADVKKICGHDIEWAKDVMEQGKGPTYCSRRGGPGGGFVRVMMGIYPHIEAARMVTRNSGNKPSIENRRVGRSTLRIAHVRKANIAASVRSQFLAADDALCNENQLLELASLVSSRLP